MAGALVSGFLAGGVGLLLLDVVSRGFALMQRKRMYRAIGRVIS